MSKWLSGLVLCLAAVPAAAALSVGTKAPDFVTTGALAGKPFPLHLKNELKKGPVVLYFFPKAFTKGCTLEAHAFSEATPEFKKAGARVIGMSADDLPTLKRFSVEACRNSFPVATASPSTIAAYDVVLKQKLELTLQSGEVGGRSRVLQLPGHLDLLCLGPAAPHGVTPLCRVCRGGIAG